MIAEFNADALTRTGNIAARHVALDLVLIAHHAKVIQRRQRKRCVFLANFDLDSHLTQAALDIGRFQQLVDLARMLHCSDAICNRHISHPTTWNNQRPPHLE